MSTFNKTSFLATFGDLPIKAAGLDVFTDNGEINGLAGEILVFNPKTRKTLDAAAIATASKVSVAVGLGKEGHMAQELRYIAGEQYDLCDFKFKSRVTRPSCGIPQVYDVYFDKMEPGKTYTMEVLLDDSWVRSNMGQNEKAKYIFQITTPKGDCADCDPTIECAKGACLFVDKINGSVQTDPTKIVHFVNHDPLKQYQPFRASQLFLTTENGDTETSRSWCLNVTGTACEDCKHVTGIDGIRIDGVDTPFTYTTDPTDASFTLIGQLDRVLKLLNEALASKGGSARLKKGVGSCCPYEIEINSCVDDIFLLSEGSPVSPTLSLNPFQSKDVTVLCQTCVDESATLTATCGFRLFVDPVEIECGCQYPDNLPAPNIFTRSIEVQKVGDWDCTGFYTQEVCSITPPEGFGYFYEQKALKEQSNGGKGGDWRNSTRFTGKYPMPDKHSRFTNASSNIDCEESYCVYNLVGTKVTNGFFNNSRTYGNVSVNYILVPKADSTTIPDWEAILAALQARGICNIADINCDVAITGATVLPAAVTLAAGEDVQLIATVQPAEAPQGGTWASSNLSAATVTANGGFVTAVATGSATITFTASDAITTDTTVVTVS